MNNVKTVALMATLGAILVVVGGALGGQSGAAFALVIAVGINFSMYFWSDKLAMKAARARPVAEHELPQVYAMIRSLAQRENMPMPDVYFVESPQPNAFATGRNPNHAAVAVTRGIMELMRPQELEAVLAHELAHVKNRDILISSIAATIAVALTFITRMAMWRAFLGGGRRSDNNPVAAIIGLASIILAPLAAVVIRSAISRSREYEADRTGAQISGAPLALASALRKLEAGTTRIPMDVNPSVAPLFIADPLKASLGRQGGGGGFARLFSTHPPIADRVERLEGMAMGIR
jgi:heat shock protein HtpX